MTVYDPSDSDACMPRLPIGLTAADFFSRCLPGLTKTEAHLRTELSYSTVHDAASEKKVPSRDTAQRLQEWSLIAVREHGVYISASMTLGLHEPTSLELAEAKKATRA